ncbi:hypothetical protein BKA64DRAFT_767649 [Cadophora sp. MPI-SDFR-AT-0126]|nr:hypothetical protein BKA64DRAFT_767649 [Leotiomycetes sp. MPI-SDFR-AT-0126]
MAPSPPEYEDTAALQPVKIDQHKLANIYAADLVGAMSMAAIGVPLWRYAMKYSPSNPNYFNRDRFVLSNGHTCLFVYSSIHSCILLAREVEVPQTQASVKSATSSCGW